MSGVTPAVVDRAASTRHAGRNTIHAGVVQHPRQPALEARALTKRYATGRGDCVAYSGVDLTVHRGELLCLLGASGCGKSSLLLTLAGLYPATAGEVRLDGRRVEGPDPRMSLIFQDACLLPWLDARHNVAFGLKFDQPSQGARRDLMERSDEALSRVGLKGFEARYPYQLSGGMAQRVALARALVRRPEILCMDEPFGALDAITRLEMQQLLRVLILEQSYTALLVTHDLDESVLLADRVVLMGGTPSGIFKEWTIDIPHPREEYPKLVGEIRLEILRELAQVCADRRIRAPAAMAFNRRANDVTEGER